MILTVRIVIFSAPEEAEVTGGEMFTIDNPNHLDDSAAKIGVEQRNQYVPGYRPSNSPRKVAQNQSKTAASPGAPTTYGLRENRL